MKQDLKTLITIRVKAPTVLEQKKLNDIFEILNARIVDPFWCDLEVVYAYNVPEDGIMSFYISRKGKFKRSLMRKLLETLEFLDKFWPDMIGYVIDHVELEGNNVG